VVFKLGLLFTSQKSEERERAFQLLLSAAKMQFRISENASFVAWGFFASLHDYSDQYPQAFQKIQERSIFPDFVDLVRMLHPHLHDDHMQRWWLPFKMAFLQATNLPDDFFDLNPSSATHAPLAMQPSPPGEEFVGTTETPLDERIVSKMAK
jgi:hypothetical protein